LRDRVERLEAELINRARLLDQSMEPVFMWRLGGPIAYWNRAAEELYGYTRSEALGRKSHDLLRTRHPLAVEKFESILEDQGYWAGELVHFAKDGRGIVVDSLHRVVPDGGSKMVLESNRDITEKRRIAEALRESQDRLRRAISAGGVGVWEVDIATGALTVSENIEEFYGLEPGSARRFEDLLTQVAPEDRGSVEAQFDVAVRTGSDFDCEFRVRGSTGERWLCVQARPGRSEHRIARLSGATLDVTAQKHAQEELRRLAATLEQRVAERTAELQDLNQELEAFAYSVSHDLRAPLRSIEGFGELLLREAAAGELNDAAQDCIRRMRRAAGRMGQLIDDLLRLSRVGRTPLRKEMVDLSAIAGDVVAELRSNDAGRSADVTIAPAAFGSADAGLIRVVLENLFGNAWKYTARRERAAIEFGFAGENGERVYFVKDNGAGFDPRHAEHLFTPFQRLHRASEFEGSGIGLATVQRIIRRHGGRVWATAEKDRGATFYFTLGEQA
jgi:PAS domain S-box-containing protein